jgi:hypothetical protein
MNLTAAPAGPSIVAQVAVLFLFLVCLWPTFVYFCRRWDRLTRHRYIRWHRGAWRKETDGLASIYQDAICRCCRHRWGSGR